MLRSKLDLCTRRLFKLYRWVQLAALVPAVVQAAVQALARTKNLFHTSTLQVGAAQNWGGVSSVSLCRVAAMAESFDSGTKETVKKLPLLTVNAGPRDKEGWEERLKQVGMRLPEGL